MVLEMDSIKFESRREIEAIMDALATYANNTNEHDSYTYEQSRILWDKLDAMYMSW